MNYSLIDSNIRFYAALLNINQIQDLLKREKQHYNVAIGKKSPKHKQILTKLLK